VAQKTALITGATGAIGPSLIQHLLKNGYAVRTFSRHQPAEALLPAAVEVVQGDLTDSSSNTLAQALSGVDVVFHLAAMLHIENPSPTLAPRYEAVNVGGTQNVINAAAQAGVVRFVYFSTVKVYGLHQREPVHEAIPPTPSTLYAQTKWKGEQVVNSAQDIETVILRLSAVYGPRLRGSWERMVKAIARGWFIPIGTLRNQRSLTYVEDVARVAQWAVESPNSAGQTYNVVGHEGVSMHAILSAIYGALGRSLPAWRLPAFAVLPAVFAIDKGLSLFGKRSPLNLDTVRQLINDEVYAGEKLRNGGFQAFTPLEQAWRETVGGLRP